MPALVGVVGLTVNLGKPFSPSGDHAILELAVRRALDGVQLVGPYSRFAFDQPGPAYFYLQSPFYWLSGGSSRALFLGAFIINLGSAVATVVVVRRQLGEDVARWAAFVVGAYLVAVGPGFLADPWNPYVIVLPTLLTMVCSAAGAAGSRWSIVAAAATGSFVVQTHVGAAPVVGVVLALAVMRLWRGSRTANSESHLRAQVRRWRFAAAAVGILALWVPTLVDELAHDPGNLTELAQFFTTEHPGLAEGHPVPDVARHIGDQLAVVPFGVPEKDARDAGESRRLAVALSGTLLATVITVAARRRDEGLIFSMALTSLAAMAAAVLAASRIVGDLMPYLITWASVLALPVWIGLGAWWLRQERAETKRKSRLPAAVAAIAAVVPAVLLASALSRGYPDPVGSSRPVTTAAKIVKPWLAEPGITRIGLRLGVHDQWPKAAGLLVELQKAGATVSVDEQYGPLYGAHLVGEGDQDVEVWLTNVADAPPPTDPPAERLGSAGDAAVWVTRP